MHAYLYKCVHFNGRAPGYNTAAAVCTLVRGLELPFREHQIRLESPSIVHQNLTWWVSLAKNPDNFVINISSILSAKIWHQLDHKVDRIGFNQR